MKRYRLPVIGCLGLIALAVVLGLITLFTQRGPYESARSRWDAKGSADYTLVVSQSCFCGLVGEYKITVKSGRVTDFEPVDSAAGQSGSGSTGLTLSHKPADFDRMTVSAMLAQAEKNQDDLWQSPWLTQVSIQYDPTYGYVTRYNSDMNGKLSYLTGRYVTDSGYSYTARDLVLAAP